MAIDDESWLGTFPETALPPTACRVVAPVVSEPKLWDPELMRRHRQGFVGVGFRGRWLQDVNVRGITFGETIVHNTYKVWAARREYVNVTIPDPARMLRLPGQLIDNTLEHFPDERVPWRGSESVLPNLSEPCRAVATLPSPVRLLRSAHFCVNSFFVREYGAVLEERLEAPIDLHIHVEIKAA